MVDLKRAVLDHRFQTVGVLAVILFATAGASMLSAGPDDAIDRITHERRHGNVETTFIFNVRTNNGTVYRYSRKEPGPGSHCNSVSPGIACDEPTEQGYKTVRTYLEGNDVPNRSRSERVTVYDRVQRCIDHANETHLVLRTCE